LVKKCRWGEESRLLKKERGDSSMIPPSYLALKKRDRKTKVGVPLNPKKRRFTRKGGQESRPTDYHRWNRTSFKRIRALILVPWKERRTPRAAHWDLGGTGIKIRAALRIVSKGEREKSGGTLFQTKGGNSTSSITITGGKIVHLKKMKGQTRVFGGGLRCN